MLDRIDREIVLALQNDARLSNKLLAARVGLAPSSCLARVRRLERSGVLKSYGAVVDPASLGIGLEAMVSVQFARHLKGTQERYRDRVLGYEEVLEVFHLAGARDLLLRVAVRDGGHLRELVMERLTGDDVAQLETWLIFQREASGGLPCLLDE